jgi:hypothetical protein
LLFTGGAKQLNNTDCLSESKLELNHTAQSDIFTLFQIPRVHVSCASPEAA